MQNSNISVHNSDMYNRKVVRFIETFVENIKMLFLQRLQNSNIFVQQQPYV